MSDPPLWWREELAGRVRRTALRADAFVLGAGLAPLVPAARGQQGWCGVAGADADDPALTAVDPPPFRTVRRG